MPTPAEQKALAFVALVVFLGGAVRVVRGDSLAHVTPSPGEQQALQRQAIAAESAVGTMHAKKALTGGIAGRKAPKRRYAGAQFDSTGVLIDGTGVVSSTGFPPPGPRIDVDVRWSRPPSGPAGARAPGKSIAAPRIGSPALIDLDAAEAQVLERLPGIGPALARRIVANRDSLGPFGVLSALGRVKGVGPATMTRLAPFVTFSAQARR